MLAQKLNLDANEIVLPKKSELYYVKVPFGLNPKLRDLRSSWI